MGIETGIIESLNQEEAEPITSEEYGRNLSEAVSCQLKFKHKLYSSDHPAVAAVRSELGKLTEDSNIRVYVFESRDEKDLNAFALPNGEIFVSSELLKMVDCEEELQALLMHELTHIEKNHSFNEMKNYSPGDVLGKIGHKRIGELESDVSMLNELDKRGCNPVGAISFFEKLDKKLAEQNKGDPFLDPVHGTAKNRRSNLREITRFMDLRNLSTKTTALNLTEALSQESGPASISSGADGLAMIKWHGGVERKAMLGLAVQTELADLSPQAQMVVTEFIFKQFYWGEKENSIDDYKVWQEILDKDGLGRLGIILLPSDLHAITSEVFAKIASEKGKSPDEVTDDAKSAKELFGKYFEKSFGSDPFLDIEFNTQLLISFINELPINKISRSIRHSDEANGDLVTFDRPLNIGDIDGYDRIVAMAEKVGIDMVDCGELMEAFLEKLGVSFLLNHFEDHYVRTEDSDVIQEIVKLADEIVLPWLDKSGQKIDVLNVPKIEKSNFKAKCFGDLYSFNHIVREVESASARNDREMGVPEDDSEYATSKPETMYVATMYPFSRAKSFTLPGIDQHDKMFNDSKEFFKEAEAFIDYAETFPNSRQKLAETLGNLSALLFFEGKAEKFEQKKILLFMQLFTKGKRDFTNFLDNLLSNCASAVDDEDDDYNEKSNEYKGFSAEGFEKAMEIYRFMEKSLDVRNRVGDGMAWGKREKASLRRFSSIRKSSLFRQLTKDSSSELMEQITDKFDEWPMVWAGQNPAEYAKDWSSISHKAINYAKEVPNFLTSPQDFEKVLCLSLLTQNNWASVSLASVAFEQMVSLSASFDEAFNYLKKYQYLPMSILQSGMNSLIENRAKSKDEIEQISEWAIDNIQKSAGDEGQNLIFMEMLGTMTGYIPDKKVLLSEILTTNESDREFKRHFGQTWWDSMPNYATKDDVKTVAFRSYYGEKQGSSLKMRQALFDTGKKPDALAESGYVAFEELYQGLYRLNDVAKYLFLRDLTTSYDGVFKSEQVKKEMLGEVLGHYLEGDNGNLSSLIDAIAEGPDADDLFYQLGPFLTSIALQSPREPYSTDAMVNDISQEIFDELGKTFEDINKTAVGKDGNTRYALPNTRLLVRSRLKTIFTGNNPKYEYDADTRKVQIKRSKKVDYKRAEDYFVNRLSDLMPERREYSEKMRPVEIAITLGENMGAIGVRWLQLIGMYFDFAPQDREKFNRIYDKVQGQTKLPLYNVLKREAEHSDNMRNLFDCATEFDGMLGGGSIVTVYDVKDGEGKSWAVGVKNPNAEYRMEEQVAFAHSILDKMKEKDPDNQFVNLAEALLDDAAKWIEAEIGDKEYVEKNEAFYKQNDFRSTESGSFKSVAGDKWNVMVPFVVHTDSDWIRWEEKIKGRELVDCQIGETTDLANNMISKEDAQEAAAAITQNYLFQLLETGLAHSDVHPGNFILTEENNVAILDRKNLLEFNESERQFALDLITSMPTMKSAELTDRLVTFFKPDLSAERLGQLRNGIEQIVSKGGSVEQEVGDVLVYLKKEGEEVPLKWLLLVKNLMGLNRISQWAGYGNFTEAFFRSKEGLSKDNVIRRVLPETAKKIGFKLNLLKFV